MKERKEQAQEMLRCLLLHLPPTLRIFLGPVDLGLLIFLVHIACKEFLLADRGQEEGDGKKENYKQNCVCNQLFCSADIEHSDYSVKKRSHSNQCRLSC